METLAIVLVACFVLAFLEPDDDLMDAVPDAKPIEEDE